MILDLTEEEHALMLSLLDREIAQLGPEIRRTDARDYREDLKHEKQVLLHLVERLRAAQTA